MGNPSRDNLGRLRTSQARGDGLSIAGRDGLSIAIDRNNLYKDGTVLTYMTSEARPSVVKFSHPRWNNTLSAEHRLIASLITQYNTYKHIRHSDD